MKRINFKSKKKLNSEVIQNDEILGDLSVFASQNSSDSEITKVLLRIAQAIKKILSWLFKLKKNSLLQYYDSTIKTAKEAFTQGHRAFGIKQFYKWGR